MRVFFRPDPGDPDSGPIAWWTESDTEQPLDAGIDTILHEGPIGPGYYVENRVVSSTPAAKSAGDLKAELAAIRYSHEIGGVDVYLDVPGIPAGTYPFDTSRETYAIISGTLAGFTDQTFTFIKWKMRNGAFLEMDQVAFINMAFAVRNHVRWSFEAEAEVAEAIDAAPDISALDIEALFETEYAAHTPGA